MNKQTFTWILGTVLSLFALVAGANTFWDTVGWTTPKQHKADFELIETDHVTAQQEVLDAIKESRDEWKCDEYDEELLDLQRELARADDDEAVQIRHQIDKIREKMRKIDCSRFEDFG